MQQIVRSAEALRAPPADAALPHAPAAVPEDVLAFVSLSRLASGDHSVADVLALASTLLRDSGAQSTLAWYLLDPATNMLAVAHASGPAAEVLRGLSIPIASKLSGWVAREPAADRQLRPGARSRCRSRRRPRRCRAAGRAARERRCPRRRAVTLYARGPTRSPTISAG